jgi:hypothetical protein
MCHGQSIFVFLPACVSAFFYFLSVGKFFKIIFLHALACKLFDKASVVALVCGALAMCLQMRGHYFI